jgi:hypothetical protein
MRPEYTGVRWRLARTTSCEAGVVPVVAVLHGEPVPDDRTAVETRRRARLEAPQSEPEPLQRRRHPVGCGIAGAAGGHRLLTDMDNAAQERPCREHHAGRRQPAPVAGDHAPDPAPVAEQHILDGGRENLEVFLVLESPSHFRPVQCAVSLGARAPHGRALASVEHPKLDAGAVDDPAHDAVQRVDLPHEVAFAEATDRRVAGHLANGLEPVRGQQGPRAGTRRCSGGLATRVAAADHDHIPAVLSRPVHGSSR